MSKIHINSKGEPGVCRAVSKPCPFGSEETHFSSVVEAEDAYSKAQELLGNASSGKSKLGNNGERVLTLASEEEALKIANLLKNEGKVSAISILRVRHPVGRPKREDYADDEEYAAEDGHFWDLSRQEVGEFTEDPPIYQLRAFNLQDEAFEGLFSIDWNDKDLLPASEDLKKTLEAIKEDEDSWNKLSKEHLDRFVGMYSESLVIDQDYFDDYDGRSEHEAFVSKPNYDHEGGNLKDVLVYFVPDLPESLFE
jgi:hypothetical protein